MARLIARIEIACTIEDEDWKRANDAKLDAACEIIEEAREAARAAFQAKLDEYCDELPFPVSMKTESIG